MNSDESSEDNSDKPEHLKSDSNGDASSGADDEAQSEGPVASDDIPSPSDLAADNGESSETEESNSNSATDEKQTADGDERATGSTDLSEIDEIEELDVEDSDNHAALIGETVAGRYEIKKQIGRGGMGIIFLAEQTKLEREVVVKVLPPKLLRNERAKKRFRREARGLSNLQHPHVVTVHDFGTHEGLPYLAMEYLEGETLKRRLYRAKRLTLRPFLRIASQILDALAEAHAQGLVHRDLKPENIMLCERRDSKEYVKLLDFGLAKLVHKEENITKQENVVGTVSYMSPEYVQGGDVDTPADVYSLGILFFVMLTGEKPFGDLAKPQILYWHANQSAPSLVDALPDDHAIPRGVIDLIEQCMALDPEHRPRDAGEVLQWLLDNVSHSKLRVLSDSGQSITPQPREGLDAIDPHDRSDSEIVRPNGVPPRSDDQQAHESERSDEQSSPSGEAPPAQQSGPTTRAWVAAIALLAAGIGALIGGILYLGRQPPESDQKKSQAKSSSKAPSESRAENIASTVTTLVEEKKFGRAEQMLETIDIDEISSPDLLSRVSKLRERIKIGKMMARAQRQAESGNTKEAVKIYEKVLTRNPSHQAAQRKLDELAEQARQARTEKTDAGTDPETEVEISSTPEGRIFLDGEFLGTTPATLHPSPGSHRLSITAAGRKPWSKTVKLDKDDEKLFEPRLQPAAPERSETEKTTSGEGAPGEAPEPDETSTKDDNPEDTNRTAGGTPDKPEPEVTGTSSTARSEAESEEPEQAGPDESPSPRSQTETDSESELKLDSEEGSETRDETGGTEFKVGGDEPSREKSETADDETSGGTFKVE